ncbi:class I SAM-dependent methyltransferase [Mycobacterium sp. 1423905.2]|uniref:class I SAM-dependent methyltransferase n=1 Tax=Mycobacterium sp. 1423905.2 TaxID=1856859 RepID=UPI0007FE2B54|nr:class I SAM-dependent methyltransferase [Mycobacterium sp. 1423905.2]OBJ50639.1 SAM-dependent methyltransferase [Mycobacterium sp. 1423905.2]
MVRTDGDTWGPATGVGMTATFGAAARAVATNQGLLNDPFAEALVRAVGVEYFTRVIDEERYAGDGGDNPLIAGILRVLGLHARFVDEFLADAYQAGLRQVVVLASGLDTRPYRLWWPRGTTVYEIDQPNVLDFKTQLLRKLGAKLSVNRCAVGIDLRQDWLSGLRRVGFDDAQPTVWVAENLFVGYLPPDAQDRLLHNVTEVSAPGSRLTADHMPTWTAAQLREGQAFVDHWRRHGVDIDLSRLTYAAEFNSVPELLAANGWQTYEQTVVELLETIGMAGNPQISPRRAEISPRYVTATRMGGRNASRP